VAHKMDQWWALENRILIQKCVCVGGGGFMQRVIQSMNPKTLLMIIKLLVTWIAVSSVNSRPSFWYLFVNRFFI